MSMEKNCLWNKVAFEKEVISNDFLLICYFQVILDDNQRRTAIDGLLRMSTALDKFFRSVDVSIYRSSCNQTCSSQWSSLKSIITRPISRPINMVIARSFTPLPSFDISVPIHLFLPSNLRGVVNYLRINTSNTNRPKEIYHYLQQNIPYAEGFICNSWNQLEEKYVDEFHRLSGNYAPVRFVGPLVLENHESTESKVSIELNELLINEYLSSVYVVKF
jgi:hypothetical protein